MFDLDANQVMRFFSWISLLEKQLNLDPTEKSNQCAFQVSHIDPYDGDFAGEKNHIDGAKLQQCIEWLVAQLGWQPGDIVLLHKNHSTYLQAKDPIALIKFLEKHRENSETISHVETDYPKAAFFTKDTHATTNLSAKGIAILQHLFSLKDGEVNDTFIAKDNHLLKLFNILAVAENGVSFTVFVRFGEAHWTPIHLIKKDNQYHIIEMDSEGISKDYGSKVGNRLITSAIERSQLDCNKVFIYRSFNMRQSGPNNCGIFTIKDGRKMQKTPDLLAEISPLIISRQKFPSGITYCQYLTPERFESTVQSKKDFDSYIKKLSELRMGQVDEMALYDASFNKRRSHPDSTVETGPAQAENKTIHYFKELYVKRVKAVVESTDLPTLKGIVDQYSMDTLTPQRVNRTIKR